ncbi:bromo adjacent homology domain-containing 1 protein [Ditylenchus destructor]|nr:bromo adjacent homology domain-containing 1 protein [Ditylenchus destructor]
MLYFPFHLTDDQQKQLQQTTAATTTEETSRNNHISAHFASVQQNAKQSFDGPAEQNPQFNSNILTTPVSNPQQFVGDPTKTTSLFDFHGLKFLPTAQNLAAAAAALSHATSGAYPPSQPPSATLPLASPAGPVESRLPHQYSNSSSNGNFRCPSYSFSSSIGDTSSMSSGSRRSSFITDPSSLAMTSPNVQSASQWTSQTPTFSNWSSVAPMSGAMHNGMSGGIQCEVTATLPPPPSLLARVYPQAQQMTSANTTHNLLNPQSIHNPAHSPLIGECAQPRTATATSHQNQQRGLLAQGWPISTPWPSTVPSPAISPLLLWHHQLTTLAKQAGQSSPMPAAAEPVTSQVHRNRAMTIPHTLGSPIIQPRIIPQSSQNTPISKNETLGHNLMPASTGSVPSPSRHTPNSNGSVLNSTPLNPVPHFTGFIPNSAMPQLSVSGSTSAHPLLGTPKAQLHLGQYLRSVQNGQQSGPWVTQVSNTATEQEMPKLTSETHTSIPEVRHQPSIEQSLITSADKPEAKPVSNDETPNTSRSVMNSPTPFAHNNGTVPISIPSESKFTFAPACDCSAIPSTSGQTSSPTDVPNIYSGFIENRYTASRKNSTEDNSPCSELAPSEPSCISLASTSPAIGEEPTSPALTYYSKNSIHSSFDLTESLIDIPENMVIDRLNKHHRRVTEATMAKSMPTSPATKPYSQNQRPPTPCSPSRKRPRTLSSLSSHEKGATIPHDDIMDQCEDLYKMPRLVPECPALNGNDADDSENTAPPPMLDAFDSSSVSPSGTSLPYSECPSSPVPALTVDTFVTTPQTSLLSVTTHSSSGVSSAASSLLLSNGSIYNTPIEETENDACDNEDSLLATGSDEQTQSSAISSSSDCQKSVTARERRRKYASGRRKKTKIRHPAGATELPKPTFEDISSDETTSENISSQQANEMDTPKITLKQTKIEPLIVKSGDKDAKPKEEPEQKELDSNASEIRNPIEVKVAKPAAEEKKVPPMKLILPKLSLSHSNPTKPAKVETPRKSALPLTKTDSRPLYLSPPPRTTTVQHTKNKLSSPASNRSSTPRKRSKSEKKKSKKDKKKASKSSTKKQKHQSKNSSKVSAKHSPAKGKSLPSPKKGFRLINCNWRPVGGGFRRSIRLGNDSLPTERTCFHAIRHWADKEEIIRERDCVKICSAEGQENVGKIMFLHYDESSKALMATVLWYYTQVQVDTSKGLSTHEMHEKELFASRHLDTVNVDCIESLAFVLTVHEFCRFSAETKIDLLPVECRPIESSEIWSRGEEKYPRRRLLPHEDTPLDLVYFCRGVYSLKTKRICLSLSLPSSSHSKCVV